MTPAPEIASQTAAKFGRLLVSNLADFARHSPQSAHTALRHQAALLTMATSPDRDNGSAAEVDMIRREFNCTDCMNALAFCFCEHQGMSRLTLAHCTACCVSLIGLHPCASYQLSQRLGTSLMSTGATASLTHVPNASKSCASVSPSNLPTRTRQECVLACQLNFVDF